MTVWLVIAEDGETILAAYATPAAATAHAARVGSAQVTIVELQTDVSVTIDTSARTRKRLRYSVAR